MATTASPPLQLATASRPHASASGGGSVGGVLLAGGSGGGVAPGRGRGRMQRRVSARSVASDRDVQGPVSPAEGTWLRPPAGPGALGEVWVAMRFEALLNDAMRVCDPCAVRCLRWWAPRCGSGALVNCRCGHAGGLTGTVAVFVCEH